MDNTSDIAYRYYRDLESALNEAGYTIYLESITSYERVIYDHPIARVIFSVGADVSRNRWAEHTSTVQFTAVTDGSKVTRIDDPNIDYYPFFTQSVLVYNLWKELNGIIDKTPASPGFFAQILAGQFRRLGFKE